MKIKNLILFVFLLIFSFSHVTFAKEPGKFIEEITSEASSVLASEDSKEDKILKLKKIAENLDQLYKKHSKLSLPEGVGRSVGHKG